MSESRRRPSLGTALGLVAVLIASSGAAFAAGVTITSSKQIKNGIVTGADLKNRGVKPLDLSNPAWRVVDTPGQPQFENGWGNAYPEFYEKVSFRKGPDGLVYLRGVAGLGTDTLDPNDIFTLPVGYRPKKCLNFIVASANGSGTQRVGAVDVCPDGSVFPYEDSDERFLSLDGISFAPG